MLTDPYLTLVTVPANDSNFIYALKKYADANDLKNVQSYLENHLSGNKTRLRAVNQEIRRRQKEADHAE